jgi:hypothetical protein
LHYHTTSKKALLAERLVVEWAMISYRTLAPHCVLCSAVVETEPLPAGVGRFLFKTSSENFFR